MGQFSWLDCKDNTQIVDDKEVDVYLLVPEEFGGGHIVEHCYDGYGHFGGHDIYDLVMKWNKDYLNIPLAYEDSWRCNDWLTLYKEDFKKYEKGEPIEQELRILGITLACYDEDNARLRYPIKITHDPDARYEGCKPSLSDPDQGWEYEDEEYDDWY